MTVRRSGKQKHYQVNPKSPIFAEMCGIMQKTMGLAEPLCTALAALAPRIRAAFVHGSVAKREDTASSDVGLPLVSDDQSYSELYVAIEGVSQRIGRPVTPTLHTPQELAGSWSLTISKDAAGGSASKVEKISGWRRRTSMAWKIVSMGTVGRRSDPEGPRG